jgi:hypothetical protein
MVAPHGQHGQSQANILYTFLVNYIGTKTMWVGGSTKYGWKARPYSKPVVRHLK